MYEIEVRHPGLGKYRHIRGKERYVVEQKAEAQIIQWDQMWARRVSQENAQKEREKIAYDHTSKQSHAEKLTAECEEKIEAVENILRHTLSVDDSLCWDSIKDKSRFKMTRPTQPQVEETPAQPQPDNFSPKLNIFDKIIKSLGDKKREQAVQNYQTALALWTREKQERDENLVKRQVSYQAQLATWEQEKESFLQKQKDQNESVDRLKAEYESFSPSAIEEYCDLVLSRSEYPEEFPQQFEVQYNPTNKTLIIDYTLPNIEDMPNLKSVSYIRSKGELKQTRLSDSAINKLYDTTLYNIALRTIHECLEADKASALEAVAFNGWVHSISKTTGQPTNACVLSLHVIKEHFLKINLAHIEPKTCFKSLKGVSAAKLYEITPIAPILKMDKSDPRFIDSYEVISELEHNENLAMMDWQDFEHLIREIFEKEFSSHGGEVKVTQSSKDGGVDAVIFDPDPLRGGKIVVQAKRYTNTVNLSAVRDLYGTLVNEGATKGILITTSDFGPDAYNFAKDKPISLLNGSNLLHLLEKHGHKARIDIQEAKKNKA